MTVDEAKRGLARIGRGMEVIGTLCALAVSALLASGWEIHRPDEVIGTTKKDVAALAVRTAALEQNIAGISVQMETVIRMQCLSISRRDANMAGTCGKYATRDESLRVSR